MTASPTEAAGFAQGGHLGGAGSDPQVHSFALSPGKIREIDAEIDKAMEEDDDIDEAISKVIKEELAKGDYAGASYLAFEHPSFSGGENFKALISLYPHRDLEHIDTARLADKQAWGRMQKTDTPSKATPATKVPAPSKAPAQPFATKKDHAAHLLKQGVTTAEMLKALGWPSISMPAMAKSLNMRLEKVKEGRVTKYRGIPLGPAYQPEKTHSLMDFLSSRGGIRSDDGNIGDLRHSIGGKNKFIPGYGQLIRKPGAISTAAQKSGRYAAMKLDTAREAAAEAGYIPEETTLPEFLDVVDRALRGEKIYPQGYVPEGRAAEPEELERQQQEFNDDLTAAVTEGGGKLSAKEHARALELWRHEGLNDPVEILERLALEADDSEIATGAPDRSGDPVTGWDVPDDDEF